MPIVPIIPVLVWNTLFVSLGHHKISLLLFWFIPNNISIFLFSIFSTTDFTDDSSKCSFTTSTSTEASSSISLPLIFTSSS